MIRIYSLEINAEKKTKRKILKKNILQYFQNHLAIFSKPSFVKGDRYYWWIRNLIYKKLEQCKEIISNFSWPTYDKTTVEPDLSYKTIVRKSLNNIFMNVFLNLFLHLKMILINTDIVFLEIAMLEVIQEIIVYVLMDPKVMM